MSTRNYVTPIRSKSLMDQEKTRLMALAAGLERCGTKGIGDLNSDLPALQTISVDRKAERVQTIYRQLLTGWMPSSISQRQLDPTTDLVAVTALEDHLTAALAAVGTYYTCFQGIVSPQLIAARLLVIFGVSLNSIPISVNKLRFRKAGAAGNLVAEYDLHDLIDLDEPSAFLSEPFVVDPQDIFAVQARCFNVTAAAEQVYLHNYLFEVPTRIV